MRFLIPSAKAGFMRNATASYLVGYIIGDSAL
jgi:hypothetical protein